MNTLRDWLAALSLCFLLTYGIAQAEEAKSKPPAPVDIWRILAAIGGANLLATATNAGINGCLGNDTCRAVMTVPVPYCVGIYNCVQPPFGDPPPVTWQSYDVNVSVDDSYAFGGMGGYEASAESFHAARLVPVRSASVFEAHDRFPVSRQSEPSDNDCVPPHEDGDRDCDDVHGTPADGGLAPLEMLAFGVVGSWVMTRRRRSGD